MEKVSAEQVKQSPEWFIENLKGAITLADSGIKSLILVNGAADVGLLTFMGNGKAYPVGLRHALVSFAVGVFMATVCAIFAYGAQRCVATGSGTKVEAWLTIPGVIFALLSAVAFGLGVYLAATAFS